MNSLQRFAAYAGDFEKTFADDDWGRLEEYFAPNAIYHVEGVPWACEVRGREKIFAAMKKSLDGFDRRMDDRQIEVQGAPEVDDHQVSITGVVRYEKDPYDPIEIVIQIDAEFDDSGRIVNLYDIYPEGQVEALEFVDRHRDEFDPSYV